MKRYHQVIVVGGGWAGVSAALCAKLAGADTAICERTDMLLGAGLVGGIMRNNGRFVATEEAINLGIGQLFAVTDRMSLHEGISFPGHNHASLYDASVIEPEIRKVLTHYGIPVYFEKRITRLKRSGGFVESVISEDGDEFAGKSFVDATGSSGPPGHCILFGNGCASCIQRCPAFGPRASLTSMMGLPEYMCTRRRGLGGAMSGACKIHKETLSKTLQDTLTKYGSVTVPLPKAMRNQKGLSRKVCQQYALPEYAENLVFLDTGYAKLMTSFFPLQHLRSLPGFENARYADPLAGGKSNSIRLTAVSPRDNTLKVFQTENLFVGGERAGVCVGHTEAIVTGALAGRNAGLTAQGKPVCVIPQSLAIGDYIVQTGVGPGGQALVPEGHGLTASHTFAGSVYFARMKALGLYVPDKEFIRKRVQSEGMELAFLSS